MAAETHRLTRIPEKNRAYRLTELVRAPGDTPTTWREMLAVEYRSEYQAGWTRLDSCGQFGHRHLSWREARRAITADVTHSSPIAGAEAARPARRALLGFAGGPQC